MFYISLELFLETRKYLLAKTGEDSLKFSNNLSEETLQKTDEDLN